MNGGPYRKSKLEYTLEDWISWVKSLIRTEPKEYEQLRRTRIFPDNSGLPNDGLLQTAIDKVEDMFELMGNKYYRRAQNNPETLDNYIVMPGPGILELLIGKWRTCYGHYWEEAHLRLQKKRFYMPTLRQFIDFKNLLESGEACDGTGAKLSDLETERILDDILGDHGEGEWLDAKFTRKNQIIFLNQNHRYEGYGVSTWKAMPLEQNSLLYNFLEEDFCYADIFGSANSQGMPTEFGDIRFYAPSELEPTVTVFENYGEPVLKCNANPETRMESIGVRPVRLRIKS